ncbi:helix-hairpin-helix domain-containing protein [Candidatus Nitrospira bockiana]
MVGSLLLKLGMLGVAVAALLWIGWSNEAPDQQPAEPNGSAVQQSAEPPRAVSPVAAPAPQIAPRNMADTRPSPRPMPAKVDLNRASLEDLQTLPGVGPVLAQRMVERRRQAPFVHVEDLLDVKGIGKKRLEHLRPLIVVGARGSKTAKPGSNDPNAKREGRQAL